MSQRFFFTVTAGRSGQHSLSTLLSRHVPNCIAAFEEPQIHPVMPFPFRTLEQKFRRRFIETHELLGRGRTLTAFETGDHAFIREIAQHRIVQIKYMMDTKKVGIYFDVSKFYARGLHVGFTDLLPRFGLLRLVRDPIRNMRSFLNRGKNFALDNNSPSATINELRLDPITLGPGELYLWAWCEMYLRFDRIAETGKTTHIAELRTEELKNPDRVASVLAQLGIDHTPLDALPAGNTNESQGFGPTQVTAADIEIFEIFRDRLAPSIRRRIRYLDNYDPWKLNHIETASTVR